MHFHLLRSVFFTHALCIFIKVLGVDQDTEREAVLAS